MKTFNCKERLVFILAVVALLPGAVAFTAAPAHADSLITYTITSANDDTFDSGGTLTGTFTIHWNGQNAIVTNATLLADGNTLVCTPTTTCPEISLGGGTLAGINLLTGGGTPYLHLMWTTINNNNPPETIFLSTTSYCTGCGPAGNDNLAANATATLVPEPATWLMLFLGISTLAFGLRRRMSA